VVDNNLNPEWNYEGELSHYNVGQALTFTVKDKDPLKPDDSLGQITVPMESFFDKPFEGELQLEGAGKGSQSFIKLRIEIIHPKIAVGMVCARGLRNADWVGKSDPYCICEVPGRRDAKLATKSVTDDLNPVWNFEGVLPEYHIEDSLQFTVKDSDPLKPDDFLGTFTLTYDQFFPNNFNGEMKLEKAGQGCDAFLTIEIFVGEREPRQAAGVTADAIDPVQVDVGMGSGNTGAGVDGNNMRPVQEDVLDTKTAPVGLCC